MHQAKASGAEDVLNLFQLLLDAYEEASKASSNMKGALAKTGIHESEASGFQSYVDIVIDHGTVMHMLEGPHKFETTTIGKI